MEAQEFLSETSARIQAIPGELAELEKQLGEAVLSGKTKQVELAETAVENLHTERRRLEAKQSATERAAADQQRKQREADELAALASARKEWLSFKEKAKTLDDALDGVFSAAESLDADLRAFWAEHHATGLEPAMLRPEAWAHFVHMRLCQTDGPLFQAMRRDHFYNSEYRRLEDWLPDFEQLRMKP